MYAESRWHCMDLLDALIVHYMQSPASPLKRGACIQEAAATNREGNTPLHYACLTGQVEVGPMVLHIMVITLCLPSSCS